MSITNPLDEASPSRMPTREPQTTPEEAKAPQPFVPNQVIAGRYTLLEMIGEGGMGEVWAARQSEPVQRKVAIKLIKYGSDSKAIIARFEQERQALAVLDHPNIARVYDGGLTSDQRSTSVTEPSQKSGKLGQPFFVMELVNGQPLVKFCDAHKLTVSDRLELFIPICRAIQHAHQKGIVHRDLKPANILVALVDGKPVPKIIDFGVAKTISGKLINETLSTQLGALVGTLEYMSPEQAGLSTEDIDTRADIYALGVVLYELLTGLRPFDSKRLRLAALDEMLRIIKEEEPPSLASRLSTDESLASMAALRKCEPARLISQVKDELDWIVHKCLEKDRNRRYESANGLVRDIERFLAHEPIEARPASPGYRLQKFYRRHRGMVWAGCLIACSLILGTVAALWGLSRALVAEQLATDHARLAEDEKKNAIKERDQKEVARREEAQQREKAETSEKRALLESQRTRAVSEFLMRDLLSLASVETQLDEHAGHFGRDVKVRDLLDRAAGLVQEKFKGQPELEAELRATIGVTYRRLGEHAQAVPHLLRALEICEKTVGPDDPSTLQVKNSLGVTYDQMGQPDKAIALHDSILASLQKAKSLDRATQLHYLNNRALSYYHGSKAREGLQLLEQSQKACREDLGPHHDLTINSSISYGMALVRQGQSRKALPLLEDTLKVCQNTRGETHPTTLIAKINLAQACSALGKHRQAEQLLEPIRATLESVLGPDHPNTLTGLTTLAKALEDQMRYVDAESLLRKIWKIDQDKFGINHLKTLTVENNLAVVLDKLGKTAEALQLCEHVCQQRSSQLGENHPEVLISMNNWAGALQSAGQHDRAIAMYKDCHRRYLQKQGPDHPITIRMLGNLAEAYAKTKQWELARQQYELARNEGLRALGKDHPDVFYDGHFLAEIYRKLGQLEKSAALYSEVLPHFKTVLGNEHPDTIITAHNLGVVCLELKRYQDSLELFEWVVNQRQRILGKDHAETLRAVNYMVVSLQRMDRCEQVIEACRTWLPVLIKKLGSDHASVFRMMHDQGSSLYMLKRYDQSAAVFEELYKLRTKKLGPAHPDTLFTSANLANSWYSMGQKEKGIALLESVYTQGKTAKDADFFRQSLLTCYQQTNQWEKALPLHVEEIAFQKKQLGDLDLRTAEAFDAYATSLTALKRWPQAIQAWRDCLAIRQSKSETRLTASTNIRLGLAYWENKQIDEAEPVLLQGCLKLKPLMGFPRLRPGISSTYLEGTRTLASLLEAKGKTEEAQRWKKEAQATEK